MRIRMETATDHRSRAVTRMNNFWVTASIEGRIALPPSKPGAEPQVTLRRLRSRNGAGRAVQIQRQKPSRPIPVSAALVHLQHHYNCHLPQ